MKWFVLALILLTLAYATFKGSQLKDWEDNDCR